MLRVLFALASLLAHGQLYPQKIHECTNDGNGISFSRCLFSGVILFVFAAGNYRSYVRSELDCLPILFFEDDFAVLKVGYIRSGFLRKPPNSD